MNLSQHFTLEEMTASNTAARKGLDNTPDEAALENLHRLAERLEAVRAAVARPVSISSGFRSVAVNAAVGGSPNSQHCYGCAADIKVAGMTPRQVIDTIIAADLPYDQLIHEFDAWVHYSIPNIAARPWRKQALIIDKEGTRPYPVKLNTEKKSLLGQLFGKKN